MLYQIDVDSGTGEDSAGENRKKFHPRLQVQRHFLRASGYFISAAGRSALSTFTRLPKNRKRSATEKIYPQISAATFWTNSSLAHCCSSSMRRPELGPPPKPHAGLRANCSRGRYLLASSMRRLRLSSGSSAGSLVLRRPSITILPFGTKRSGSNPPARSVSYSSRKRW